MTDYYDDSLDDLDTGIAVPGPWLDWHVTDNHGRTILAGGWSLREAGGQDEPFALKSFVLDWPTSRTGWKENTGGVKGVSPRKQWNASRKKFDPPPTGGDFRKAFQAQVAYAPDQRALWEQNGFGAYVSYLDLMGMIAATAPGELPNLPLLAFTGKREIRTGGGPTLIAMFEVLRYVPAPACLVEMRALMAATATPALAAPADKPAPAVKPAAEGWEAQREAPVVTIEATAVTKRGSEQINEEVPIEAYSDPDQEIPW